MGQGFMDRGSWTRPPVRDQLGEIRTSDLAVAVQVSETIQSVVIGALPLVIST
jgi:hypothetical protein